MGTHLIQEPGLPRNASGLHIVCDGDVIGPDIVLPLPVVHQSYRGRLAPIGGEADSHFVVVVVVVVYDTTILASGKCNTNSFCKIWGSVSDHIFDVDV